MITRLNGTLIEKHAPYIVVDVQGVGYELQVSMTTFYQLPLLNSNIQLHTQLIIREDAHSLFGFADEHERSVFRQLIKIGGIGAKTALGVLSTLSPDDLSHAIANKDIKKLSSAPSIGKKTAERMIVELQGKLTPIATTPINAINDHTQDVLDALMALGYTEKEAQHATKHLPEHTSVSDGIKMALKSLMKQS